MKMYIALALAASALALPASAAERKFDADACAKAVAPYLDEQTFAVLHVDLTAVDVDALAAKAAELAKVDADAVPFPRKEAAAAVKALTDAGARDVYVVVSLADVPERSPFLVIPLAKDADSLRPLCSGDRAVAPADRLRSARGGSATPWCWRRVGDAQAPARL